MSAPELKPCPFCGGGAVLSADMARYPQCACDACGAYCGQTNEEGVEAAITAWNTRADLAPAAPKVSDNDEQLRIWAQEILEALALADVLDVREYHQKVDAHCAVVDELRRILAALEAHERRADNGSASS